MENNKEELEELIDFKEIESLELEEIQYLLNEIERGE